MIVGIKRPAEGTAPLDLRRLPAAAMLLFVIATGNGCIELQQLMNPQPANTSSAIVFFNENANDNGPGDDNDQANDNTLDNENTADNANSNSADNDNDNENDGGSGGIPALPPGIPLIPTSSGVSIAELVTGEGELFEEGDTIRVTYTGWLEDGTVFCSQQGEEGVEFDSNILIDGWVAGMIGMRVGGSRRLVIPPELAYGAAGTSSIPPDATLTFDVDLLEIL